MLKGNEITLVFKDLRPVSTNDYIRHTRRGTHYKTNKAVWLIENMERILMSRVIDCKALRAHFEALRMPLVLVDMDVFLTHSDIFTKAFKIKQTKTLDLDNCLKCVFDTVFRFIGIDDVNIFKISTRKIPHDHDEISMRIKVIEGADYFVDKWEKYYKKPKKKKKESEG